ncbi:von Willebrand factor A domain-containing protein 5A-like [Garra rufa]|uniref:von Willebrand factor A domain-containing protein 5A-like n=1 Tax=Garra rufa TaxID=137080 RepID=UPI003CCE8263
MPPSAVRGEVPGLPAALLTDLTRKGQPEKICWTTATEEAFARLKMALTSSPVLRAPDFGCPFLLQTDASDTGLGAVLSQIQEGEEHPIIYISRKLSKAGKNYAAVEKEALAIKWAVLELRYYLLGRKFTLVTDHAPLQWMAQAKDTNARLTCWFLSLQDFHFEVRHRAGAANANADGLSRMWTAFAEVSEKNSITQEKFLILKGSCCQRYTQDTLLLLLKSLPMGCYFNIYGFGSHFESFFPRSVVYKQKTMDKALKRVKEMQADMGGTKILQPLKHIYSQPCYPDHPRQLFIFTDGKVFNTKEVLDLVKSHAHSHRCFSFGIGEGASAALITGMAREGSGHAQFITDTDRMQPKVMQSLRFALQPAVVNISVDWTLPDGVTVDTLSPPINVLFQGQRTLIYAQLKGESSGESEGSVTVKYSLNNQPVTNQLNFCLKPTEETGLSIHRLAARTLIRSLEQEERSGAADVECIRSRMVELSVQAGVSSVHTAFIAVNKNSRQIVNGPLLQRGITKQGKYNGPLPTIKHDSDLANFRGLTALSLQAKSQAKRREPQKDPFLQLVSFQKASGCWELDATLADVFGKRKDELTNQKPAQVDKSVWATLLALIWLYGCKIEQQVEWQFVAMKAASWIGSQKVGDLSQCVCVGNVLLGCQVTKETLGI